MKSVHLMVLFSISSVNSRWTLHRWQLSYIDEMGLVGCVDSVDGRYIVNPLISSDVVGGGEDGGVGLLDFEKFPYGEEDSV